MNDFDGAAYNMAAVTATIALYRALVKKGVMPREDAMQILLDNPCNADGKTHAGTTSEGENNRD